jgi:hypothetical protein
METRTASSANGSPSSQPSGRHSPPSPQQHITGRSLFLSPLVLYPSLLD